MASSEPLLTGNHEDKDGLNFNFNNKNNNNSKETEKFLLPQLSVKLKHDIILVKKKKSMTKRTQESQSGWEKTWIVRWGHSKVVDPFFIILSRGLEPKLLSFSMALGITFGLFPIWGAALVFCLISAMILQTNCHVPTLMLANFVVAPCELGMLVPFVRVGEVVTGGNHFEFSPGGLWEAIKGRHSRDLMFGVLHAVIGWCVFAPICICVLYVASLPAFGYLISRFGPSHKMQEHTPIYDDPLIVRLNDDDHFLARQNEKDDHSIVKQNVIVNCVV